jgi:hypothetical protein
LKAFFHLNQFKIQIVHISRKGPSICCVSKEVGSWGKKMSIFAIYTDLGGAKEYIERRHGEPFKFLFLPKMGLLGSQAVLEKSPILNYEQLFSSVFSTFHWQKIIFFNFFLHCSVRTKKLLNKEGKKIEKIFGRIFFGLKTGFFRASCFGLFWF